MENIAITGLMADFICRLGDTDTALEPGLSARIHTCILDALENCFSCASDVRKTGAFQTVSTVSSGGALLWGTCVHGLASDAAFYNGVSGAIASRNDISRIGKCHPGSVVVPAVFAAAEQFHLSGRQVMAGVLAGYEIMIRVGNTLRHIGLPSCFRGTAMCGPIGAAAAVSAALGLNPEQTASAIALSVHSSFGLNEWTLTGTGEDALQNGWSARNGYHAALLAKFGVPGAKTIFEGRCGWLEAWHGHEAANYLTERLGQYYYIHDIRFKEISACINVQSAGQAAQELARRYNLDPSHIASVLVEVSRQSKTWPGCDNAEVHGLVQAIMSIQFTVAQALIHRDCTNIQWAPPYSPQVQELMKKCVIAECPEFTKIHFERQKAAVTVTMDDGTSFSYRQEDVRSLNDDEAARRFQQTLTRLIGEERAQRAGELVRSLGNMENIQPLIDCLSPSTLPSTIA